MNFNVEPLPYAKDALEPMMSAETVEYHYEKHHKGYMAKLCSLLKGKAAASKTLEEIVKASSGIVFNNAAQTWNHTFFWNSLKPNGGGIPAGGLRSIINRDFGGLDKFYSAFKTEGMKLLGSGWVWLVIDDGNGKIITTSNAKTPLTTAQIPLIVCDVWEHAYYIDHRNKRDEYLDVFCEELINWDFAAKNLELASPAAHREQSPRSADTLAIR